MVIVMMLVVTTVDGRSPAQVEVGSLSHYLQGFIHLARWLAGILPSTVLLGRGTTQVKTL